MRPCVALTFNRNRFYHRNTVKAMLFCRSPIGIATSLSKEIRNNRAIILAVNC
jgi:uncharacterized membrane protein YqgA involved in biofilm formation